jgi:hypothetical protein
MFLLRPEAVLEARQPGEALREVRGRRRLVAAVRRAGIDVGEADPRSGLHPEQVAQ